MKRNACFAVVLGLLAIISPARSEDKDEPNSKKLVDIKEFSQKLKEAVKTGKLTKKEAITKYKEFLTARGGGKLMQGKSKAPQLTGRIVYKGRKEKAGMYLVYVQMLSGGKGNSEKSPYITFSGEQFRKRFEKYKTGDTIQISLGKAPGGLAMKDKFPEKGGARTFYSIIVGKLKTKDIELGEFTLTVDYVTAIYGDRSLKRTLIGKTIKVVGLSGPWLDKLLLIKRGETLKFRSGTIDGSTISLSPKATVLEKAAPFDSKVYPVPPKEFRGFRGVVLGKIISMSTMGYELTLKVGKTERTFEGNAASKPASIEGRLLDMQGFYNESFRKKFDGLRIGDTIRVGAVHSNRTSDNLTVSEILEKVVAQPGSSKKPGK